MLRWSRERRVLGAAICLLVVGGGLAVRAEGPRRHDDGERTAQAAPRRAPSRPTPSAAPDPRTGGGDVRVQALDVEGSEPVLHRFGDCQAVLDHVRGQALDAVTAYGLPHHGTPAPGAAVAVSGSAAGADGGGAAGGSGATAAPAAGGDAASYSTTNTQEKDVDEPDVVKNDGVRAFTLFAGVLRAVAIEPTGARVIAEQPLGLPDGAELLQVGDRIVVLSQHDPRATTIVIVDTATLAIVDRAEVEGAYVSARRIGDTVRLVVTQNGPAFPFTYPQSDEPPEMERALQHNRRAIRDAALAEWLPDLTLASGRRLVPVPACEDLYTPSSFAGPGSTTVVTIDPSSAEVVDATSVLASATEVYATLEHLYVATSAWDLAGAAATTEIHRFDVSDPTRSVYEASGSVAGRLLRPPWFVGMSNLGQWALSEHEGDLRVATTIETASQALSNAVTVLRRADDALVPIGNLGGLGVGEQLYAIRFMGTRGFVVTYMKVDPLFVLDLADPTAPRVVGELKVRGYSSYLHPVADGFLLGIGQDDDNEDGLADGSQISMYDVRDPTAPTRTAQLRLGDRGTLTGVEGDHRSFTWWPEPARAIVTVTDFEDPAGFHGVIVVDVATDGLREVGRIQHRDGSACAAPISRSRVVGDALLTFSHLGVGVDDLGDTSPRSFLHYRDVDNVRSCPSAGQEGD